jgi:hypothetical protein
MTVYLSTLAPGLARAETQPGGKWSVEVIAPQADMRCLAADPHTPRTLFAGTQGSGVLRSDDAGLTFAPSGLDGLIVKSLAVHPSRPGHVYAGTKPPRLFASEDGGRHWLELKGFQRVRRFFWFSPAEPPFTAYVLGIAISDTNPDIVVAGIEAGAVVRSGDGGRTWQGHRPGAHRDCHTLQSAHGRFFEGGGTGAAVSDDGGLTWSRPPGLRRKYGWAVAADPADASLWYLSSAYGIRAHSDHADAAIHRCRGGGAWHELSGGLPQPMDGMPYALIAGPEPQRLVAGLSNGELWETRDAGDSWVQLGFKLPGVHRSMIRIEDT